MNEIVEFEAHAVDEELRSLQATAIAKGFPDARVWLVRTVGISVGVIIGPSDRAMSPLLCHTVAKTWSGAIAEAALCLAALPDPGARDADSAGGLVIQSASA